MRNSRPGGAYFLVGSSVDGTWQVESPHQVTLVVTTRYDRLPSCTFVMRSREAQPLRPRRPRQTGPGPCRSLTAPTDRTGARFLRKRAAVLGEQPATFSTCE
jgi:hypothetical protein